MPIPVGGREASDDLNETAARSSLLAGIDDDGSAGVPASCRTVVEDVAAAFDVVRA